MKMTLDDRSNLRHMIRFHYCQAHEASCISPRVRVYRVRVPLILTTNSD